MDEQDATNELMALLNSGGSTTPFSQRIAGFDVAMANRVTAAVRARREAAGDTVVGRKIGFTNQTIWERYGVNAPMWNYVWKSTLFDLHSTTVPFRLGHLSEPRLEPEVIFGMSRSPEPGMSIEQLAGCIDWISHGFEIVQSVFPGWKFAIADCAAAYGLHGALFVSTRHRLDDVAKWVAALQDFRLTFSRDGEVVDTGVAANILGGGPLVALRHVVEVIASDGAPPIQPGEVVTTGTITDAYPCIPGEGWETTIEGIDLDGARIGFG
jgi:2-oxo-3-hexenedioate decarboxylase